MRAVTFTEVGDPFTVLNLSTVAVPAPKRDEIRVRVSRCVIHPADFLFIRGVYRIRPVFPQVAGFDGVGIVEALGEGVDERLLGRRVAFRAPGAWAEYAIASVSRIHPVPEDVSDEVACQFSLNPFTAWGLLREASLRPGCRLLLTAGRSNVARLTAKLAERRGISANLVARSGPGYSVVDLHGEVIGRPGSSISAALARAGQEGGFEAIFDPVGGPASLELMDIAATGSVLITYGVLDDRPFETKASTMIYKNLIWRGFGYDRFMSSLDEDMLVPLREELWDLLRIAPDLLPIKATYSLDQVKDAVNASSTGSGQGKVVLCTP